MTINQRVKQVRTQLGLSQAKFAAGISISNGYIAGIELENRKVNERIVKLICSTYGVNEEWLKNGTGEMFNQSSGDQYKRALEIFQKLNPDFQNYVLDQCEKLLALQEAQPDDDNAPK